MLTSEADLRQIELHNLNMPIYRPSYVQILSTASLSTLGCYTFASWQINVFMFGCCYHRWKQSMSKDVGRDVRVAIRAP
jgi:hypothetical protein